MFTDEFACAPARTYLAATCPTATVFPAHTVSRVGVWDTLQTRLQQRTTTDAEL